MIASPPRSPGIPWRHFLHAHYICNALLVLSYFYLRDRYPVEDFRNARMWGPMSREVQVAGSVGLLLFVRSLSAPTVPAAVEQTLLFLKTAVAAYCGLASYPLLGTYLSLVAAVWLLFPAPPFRGPNRCRELDRDDWPAFRDRSGGGGESGDSGESGAGGTGDAGGTGSSPTTSTPPARLLFCYTSWATPCRHALPAVNALSLRFHPSRELEVARVDLGRLPHVAEQLGISLSVRSRQLPTVVLFEGGRETARMPVVSAKGTVGPARFRVSDMMEGLRLERFRERSG